MAGALRSTAAPRAAAAGPAQLDLHAILDKNLTTEDIMKRLIRSILVEFMAVGLVGLVAGPSAAQTPAASASEPQLTLSGDVPRPLVVTASELKAMTRTTVTVSAEGRRNTYEGVLVGHLLQRAGAPLGGEFRGEALATYVLATAKDGYRVLYSLGELDPALTPNDILVADTIDGQPLADNQGPFRIVAPRDSRAVRGVRMLQRLDVVTVRPK